ncbi:hypothetical protein EGD98_20675 [Halomicroarcula sp. F24A]|uniref:PGF-CTERM protein n=1 Tax=Haloarcula salinisoli TaxID=2487746 RepID=A0A8J7YMM7_9EURY|nr:hypothetical protein [Halomicroarcula salinisoli]
MGAGTTTVVVQPESTTITAGETTTVDIVVESADDGVGSIDLELTVADASVADITDVSVAGDPSTVRTTADNDSTRIAATGMDTADTGSVTVATVTLAGESGGTSPLDLTVAAVGNESGSAYNVSGTTSGELTVEGEAKPTPTETDDDSSSGGGSSNDGGGFSGGGDDDDDSGSVSTPTATPTATPTPTPDTETPTPTPMESPTATETSEGTATQSPSVTGTPTDSTTDTTSTESSSLSLVPLAVVGGLVILIAGVVYYQRE